MSVDKKKNQIRSLECFTHFNQIIDYPFQLYRRVKKKLNDDDLKTNLAYILHVLFFKLLKFVSAGVGYNIRTIQSSMSGI